MDRLNYHHLRYFREVAHDGQLGRTAERLGVSQSALSMQIRELEARLGHDLFDRVGRTLALSEAGRIALEHADRIFGAGAEMLATFAATGTANPPLRVGALSTLSRNFQLQFLRPVLTGPDAPEIILRSGDGARLLAALEALELDVVLTTELPQGERAAGFAAQAIAEQEVAVHGTPARLDHPDLATLLAAEPVILPAESTIRAGFDSLVARIGVAPRIAATVDDMAMVRLLTREDAGVAIAPSVVLADEIAAGLLATAPFALGIKEPFFAVTVPRRFPHPRLAGLLESQHLPGGGA